jgi:head-tail adaptor
MLASSLKYSITIQKKTETQDTLGSPVDTWADFKTVRSNVFYGTGVRGYESEQEESLHSYSTTFIFRHLNNFGYNCRIKFDNEIFDIISIEKIRRRDGFKVITERRESND